MSLLTREVVVLGLIGFMVNSYTGLALFCHLKGLLLSIPSSISMTQPQPLHITSLISGTLP